MKMYKMSKTALAMGSADTDRSVSVWFLVCKLLFPYT